MSLDDLVKDSGGFSIERVDRDRGFKINVTLLDTEEDKKYTLDTYVSPHVEDTPWTREKLTNDKVSECIENVMEDIKEDDPQMEFVKATIKEITEVRKIK